jgi:hypothetical protein
MKSAPVCIFNGPASVFRIEGDMTITFDGHGDAEFLVMHNRGFGDEPDPIGWAEVMDISKLTPDVASGLEVFPLVKSFAGPTTVHYRRGKANFILIAPVSGAFMNYTVTAVPLEGQCTSAFQPKSRSTFRRTMASRLSNWLRAKFTATRKFPSGSADPS